jgi:uncharacterized protein
MSSKEELRARIEQLKGEIAELGPPVVDEDDEDEAEEGNANEDAEDEPGKGTEPGDFAKHAKNCACCPNLDGVDEETLKLRRQKQHQMEIAVHLLAEILEVERVGEVKEKAVASGLVVSPYLKVITGECPLCLEEFPEPTHVHATQLICCGSIVCKQCLYGVGMRIVSGRYQSSGCPFCRCLDSRKGDRLMEHAKAGKGWAQHEVGTRYLNDEKKEDRYKAVHWFGLAAEQGNIPAQIQYCELWDEGFPEIGIPRCEEKANKYLLDTARLGNPWSQLKMAESKEGEEEYDDEAIMWMTLAAAQDYPPAQYALGNLYCDQLMWEAEWSTFRALYWVKKGAFIGDKQCQLLLGIKLLCAKRQMFDGESDVAGHNAVPESLFWFMLACGNQIPLHIMPREFKMDKCGCCKTPESDDIPIKRCAGCLSIGYCSKDCQTKHWKMGHKMDCKGLMKFMKSVLKEKEKDSRTRDKTEFDQFLDAFCK